MTHVLPRLLLNTARNLSASRATDFDNCNHMPMLVFPTLLLLAVSHRFVR